MIVSCHAIRNIPGEAQASHGTRGKLMLLADLASPLLLLLDAPCRSHLNSLCSAIVKDNANLAAYFAYSLLDTFEWADGYRPRYGIVHVDRSSKKLQRYPKLSAYWLSHHFFRCDGAAGQGRQPSNSRAAGLTGQAMPC